MYCALAQSDVMCSTSSRAKRTSLPKETSRTKCASRSAQAEHIVPNKRALLSQCSFVWRRHPDLNRGIRVLQTRALPLGYGAVIQARNGEGKPSSFRMNSDCRISFNLNEKRARITCPCMERITGLEPATSTLARWRSTK